MAEMEKDLEKGTTEEAKAEAETVEEVVEEILEECEECADEEDETSEEAETTEQSSKGPSKWLKKNKDKEKIAELEDRVMRQMAEFENVPIRKSRPCLKRVPRALLRKSCRLSTILKED